MGYIGQFSTDVHQKLCSTGWHQISSSLNSSVIMNVYTNSAKRFLVLFIDRYSLDVVDIA